MEKYDAIAFKDWLEHPVTKDLFKIWDSQEFQEEFGWGQTDRLTYTKFKEMLKNGS